MDPKLTLLFLLIGTVVGLSHLSDDSLSRMRRQAAAAGPACHPFERRPAALTVR